MSEQAFSGKRLRLARIAAGLSQGDLAAKVATNATFISEIERDNKEPGKILAQAFGEVLGFETAFFYNQPPIVFETDEVNFRHRASTPAYLKGRIAAKASLFRYVAKHLGDSLGFPEFDVPSMQWSQPEEIESAAAACREHWGLGTMTPISNMVRLAENAGIVVTEFKEADKVDAFSAKKDDIGVIVLNTIKESASRARWNIAHEIGHFVGHSSVITGTREREREADLFAAALLMPRDGFARDFRSMARLDWAHLFELKRTWKVAVAAIIRRAFELELLRAVDYRRLYKSLSARGWRKKEPHEPDVEKPELMLLAVNELGTTGKTLWHVAQSLAWSRQKMEDVTGFQVREPRPDNVESLAHHRAKRNPDAGPA